MLVAMQRAVTLPYVTMNNVLRARVRGGIGQAGSKTRVLGSEVGRPGGADQGGEVPCRGISRLSARAPEIKPPRPRSQGINVV